MSVSQPWRGRPGAWGAIALMVLALAGLQGCAHQPPSEAAVEGSAAAPSTDARKRAQIRLELAANYLQAGKTDVALDEVRQALLADPGYADAYHLQGLVYMARQDWARADASLQYALKLRPDDPDVMHNLGWLQCQREDYAAAQALFARVLATPGYASRTKTLMSQGFCYERAGQLVEAQEALMHAYEFDAGNPIVGYHLASVIFARGDAKRAQFYIRRVNNGEFSNAASLWLGVKVERALGDTRAMGQLEEQLHKRYPQSREALALERGAFDE